MSAALLWWDETTLTESLQVVGIAAETSQHASQLVQGQALIGGLLN